MRVCNSLIIWNYILNRVPFCSQHNHRIWLSNLWSFYYLLWLLSLLPLWNTFFFSSWSPLKATYMCLRLLQHRKKGDRLWIYYYTIIHCWLLWVSNAVPLVVMTILFAITLSVEVPSCSQEPELTQSCWRCISRSKQKHPTFPAVRYKQAYPTCILTALFWRAPSVSVPYRLSA